MSQESRFLSTTNVLLIKDGSILLMKRAANSEHFPGWYILPGGKQENSETPLQTAIRETYEETGIKVEDPLLKVIATHYHEYKNTVYIVYIFSASKFVGNLTNSSEGEAVWMPVNEAIGSSTLFPDLKRHINLIVSADTNTGLIYTYHRFNEKLEIVESL